MADRCPNCGFQVSPDTIVEWGGFSLDERGKMLTLATGVSVELTPNHATLMGALIRGSGRVLSKDALFGSIYAHVPDADWPEMKIVDVYVCKIRKMDKTLYDHIGTVWGRGYRLTAIPA